MSDTPVKQIDEDVMKAVERLCGFEPAREFLDEVVLDHAESLAHQVNNGGMIAQLQWLKRMGANLKDIVDELDPDAEVRPDNE